jgi:hypothetical protein
MKRYIVSNPVVEKLLLLERPPDSILISELLQLSRQSLIADFEGVVTQLIRDFNDDTDESLTALHCIFFLTELKSEESLSVLFKLAKQDDDFLECYFGDHMTETMWQDTLIMGKNNLDLIFEFLKTCDTNSEGVSFITDGLNQIALHYPASRKRIIAGLEDLYRYNFTYREDYRIAEFDWLKLLVTGIKGVELLDAIRPYFENGRMDGYVKWGDFVEDVNTNFDEIRPLMSLKERYENYATPDIEFDNELDEIRMFEPSTPEELAMIKIRTEALFKSRGIPMPESNRKVGRNEPCACGSGKKYKHCCLQD